jgi:hypothetical protein
LAQVGFEHLPGIELNAVLVDLVLQGFHLSMQGDDLDPLAVGGQRMLVDVAEQLADLFMVLVRHQPHADLGRSLAWQDRLGAFARVAAPDAVAIKRGSRGNLFQHGVAFLAPRRGNPCLGTKDSIVERHGCQT